MKASLPATITLASIVSACGGTGGPGYDARSQRQPESGFPSPQNAETVIDNKKTRLSYLRGTRDDEQSHTLFYLEEKDKDGFWVLPKNTMFTVIQGIRKPQENSTFYEVFVEKGKPVRVTERVHMPNSTTSITNCSMEGAYDPCSPEVRKKAEEFWKELTIRDLYRPE